MKMYYNNRFTTALLAITTIGLYVLKYVCSRSYIVKLFSYLMIFALNLILCIITIVNTKSLIHIHKSGKGKSDDITKSIKSITDTKVHFAYYIVAFAISFIAVLICIRIEPKGIDVFYYLDIVLDAVTCSSIISFLIHRCISYSIYVDLENEKPEK